MSSLGDILKALKSLILLADDVQRYHAEIKEIRQELRDLTVIVHGLAQEIKHSKERAEADRERVLLEVENKMLRLERRLPPAKDDE